MDAHDDPPKAKASATDPATSTSTSTSAEPPNANQPLSKNAQKRLAKAARIAELKKERRAYEKEKRKEKKRQVAAKRAAGEMDGDEGEDDASRKKARTEGPRTPFDARIVVDLGFDSMMSDNEIKSLTSQLAYTYSANRKAAHPFSAVLFTSLNGRTHTRLESLSNAAYKRWHDTEWWEDSYEKLWEGEGQQPSTSDVPSETANSAVEGSASTAGDIAKEPTAENLKKLSKNPQRASRESVVYLTADSTDELTELKEGETYIIGGICDHNRYKNLCLNKSITSQIRSARLPIGTYLAELRTRKVLTVNQTFEILLKWVESRDWRRAFEEVVPKRKFKEGGEGKGKSEAGEEDAEGEGEDETVVVDAAALEEDEPLVEDDVDTVLEPQEAAAPEQNGSIVTVDGHAQPELPRTL